MRAPFRYVGTAGEVVRRLKFDRDHGAALWLARALADDLGAAVRGPRRRFVLVSVPMFDRKRRTRGLDHAALLAECSASRLGLPWRPRVLERVRDTLPQGDPRVTSRDRNVALAFRVRRPKAVDGRRVVLVDDVTTSGSTARECARILRAAGARQVILAVAAMAREPARRTVSDAMGREVDSLSGAGRVGP